MTYLSIDVESDATVSYEYSYKLKTKSQALREFFAEFFGTFVMNVSHNNFRILDQNTNQYLLFDSIVDGDGNFGLVCPQRIGWCRRSAGCQLRYSYGCDDGLFGQHGCLWRSPQPNCHHFSGHYQKVWIQEDPDLPVGPILGCPVRQCSGIPQLSPRDRCVRWRHPKRFRSSDEYRTDLHHISHSIGHGFQHILGSDNLCRDRNVRCNGRFRWEESSDPEILNSADHKFSDLRSHYLIRLQLRRCPQPGPWSVRPLLPLNHGLRTSSVPTVGRSLLADRRSDRPSRRSGHRFVLFIWFSLKYSTSPAKTSVLSFSESNSQKIIFM